MTLLIFLISLFVFIVSFLIYFLDSDIVTKIFKRSSKYNIQDEMNLFDEAKWIEKVLLSCKNHKQLRNADKLTDFLRDKYRNKVEFALNQEIWKNLSDVYISLISRLPYD